MTKPISLSRIYTGILREDFSPDEQQALATCPSLHAKVAQQVWHPSHDELAQWLAGHAEGELHSDIDFHLNIDQCASCKRWMDAGTLRLLAALGR
jgi:hypothetical protein